MHNITIVGCGTMGSHLTDALMNVGCNMTIVDPNEAAAAPFVERGANYEKDVNNASDCECVLINLPNHDIAGPVVKSLDKEKFQGKILLNTTTSTIDEVKDMDAIVKEKGMIHLDAKLEVYPGDIGTDNGYVVYSGNKDAFDKLEDALKGFGKAEYLSDDIVAAAVTDIAALEVHFAAMGAMAEVASFGIKNGISVSQMMQQIHDILPNMIEGNYRSFGEELKEYNGSFDDATECTLDIEATALDTILKSIKDSGVETPVGDATLDLFNKARDMGQGKKNVVAAVKVLLDK